MVRYSLTALVVLTSFYALLLGGFSLLGEPAEIFAYFKLLLAAIVIGSGLLVLRWQWMPSAIDENQRWWVFVGGLSLIEIGTANIVWSAHLGLVTGDWEFYGFVGGALISLLGGLVAIFFAFPHCLEDETPDRALQ